MTRVGPYRLVERLGAGGMGEVYRAYHERLERWVALKQIRPEAAENPEARRRFVREARMVARLSHPNIVQIHDILEQGGADWIVMELIEGTTLHRLLESGPLDWPRALPIASEIVSGLAAAHAEGIVHRDLKAENVVLTRAGHAKILDFGLAKSFLKTKAPTFRTEDGRISGTPRAMSPEQVRGRQVDHRSDLFSLGTLLYEIVTGTSPFIGAGKARTLAKICTHRQTSAHEGVAGVPRRLSDLIDHLLEKDPAHRPQSAEQVLRVLERLAEGLRAGNATPTASEPTTTGSQRTTLAAAETAAEAPTSRRRLRLWPPPELPERPYPLLLPYTHPALLGGRERDLAHLRRALRLPVPILGVHASSGVGKSSLLAGGVVPVLRAEGLPVAFTRHPHEPGLAGRLIGDLLAGIDAGDPALQMTDGDPSAFVDRLLEVERLAGKPAILVLDQCEDVFIPPRSGPARTRPQAVLGVLLAASLRRRPGRTGPLCRWVLAYRQEFHGEAVAWLGDVLYHAEKEGLGAFGDLPRDLSGPDRFHNWPLRPLGTPLPGTEPAAAQAFLDAIEAPLALRRPDGTPRYPWRFAPGDAARLAEAFAEARLAQPDAPLTPELQVVLAHLLAQAADGDPSGPSDPGRLIRVPDEPARLIDEALEDHLRRALEQAFPAARAGAWQSRARALLALRELADTRAQRAEGLPVATLARAIGPQGDEILEKLAAPVTRLVVSRRHQDSWCYVLSHDRLAEVIVRLVEKEGRQSKLSVDAELLNLRRFVALKSALYRSQEEQATRMPRRRFQAIGTHADALLLGEDRRRWWAACQLHRRADRQRWILRSTVATLALVLVALGAWIWARRQAERTTLLEQLAEGEPEAALSALDLLLADPDADPAEVRTRWRRRESPLDVLERGLGVVDAGRRGAVVLRVAEAVFPLVEETPEDPVLIANLVWALDFFPGREAPTAAAAQRFRDAVLGPLRRRRPPPRPAAADGQWAAIPGGRFLMGTGPGATWDDERSPEEHPRHEVELSPFRILDHEVTHAEYRRLFPDHPGEDDLPVTTVSWHEAYTFAAWLGGRLPTEAEWEYAARAACPHAYCTRTGAAAELRQVGWYQGNMDPEAGPILRPVRLLEPNPWGLYDMYGNVWEWAADWHDAYTEESQSDPMGPPGGAGRVLRGGSFDEFASRARAAFRFDLHPSTRYYFLGFRVVLDDVAVLAETSRR